MSTSSTGGPRNSPKNRYKKQATPKRESIMQSPVLSLWKYPMFPVVRLEYNASVLFSTSYAIATAQ